MKLVVDSECFIYKNSCYSLISSEVYLFFQTVLYINPPQIILFANFWKLISSSFHHLDMTLAVAEALHPNTPICKVLAELYRPSGLLLLCGIMSCEILSIGKPEKKAHVGTPKCYVKFEMKREKFCFA